VSIAELTAIRSRKPERVVLAAPVARAESHESLRPFVEELACLEVPEPFQSVHTWSKKFPERTGLDVRRLQAQASVRSKRWAFPR